MVRFCKTSEKERMEEESEWGSELFLLREDATVTRKEAFLSNDTLRFRCRVWRTDGKNLMPARFFARTVLKVKKWDFLWNIEGFSSLQSFEKTAHAIVSESQSEDMILRIRINNEGGIMILVDTDKSIKFLKCQPFITVTNGTQIDCGKHETSSFMDDVLYTLPLTKNYLMKNKNLFLENDVLTLYCECSWSDGFALEGIIERINNGFCHPHQ
ncbi:TD and POZ domain-containing protein 5 [Trichonephila inaurata madagascariensis]|uniref:TD and POZ domain-containing protein 5 n=1 Tax=Trichonephila inaurata madagascariensis TaxID=2747483 RepID=A0A8X6IV85_9ARAC|nr:TD and POZ domain-containing protein 5 [Trichonephila inaurata madagascariensis]